MSVVILPGLSEIAEPITLSVLVEFKEETVVIEFPAEKGFPNEGFVRVIANPKRPSLLKLTAQDGLSVKQQ